MPVLPKVPEKLHKVEEKPDLGLGIRWMTVARNRKGNVFLFSEDNMAKGAMSIRRTFSKGWKTMKQVTTMKGSKVKCVEVFEQSM